MFMSFQAWVNKPTLKGSSQKVVIMTYYKIQLHLDLPTPHTSIQLQRVETYF